MCDSSFLVSPQSGATGLVAEHDLYRLLVESISDYAIFLLDPRGFVVSWNPGAQRIKGYAADEIIGSHISVFYPTGSTLPAAELRRAAEAGRSEDDGWRVRKDGTQFWAHVVITALRGPEGELVGFAKVTQDLSERKAAEVELLRSRNELAARVVERTADLECLNVELRAAVESAMEASQAKTDFLSRMSHELRTPLNAILGFGQLLEVGSGQSEDVESLHYILKAGRHLLKLIDDVLDITRIQTGTMEMSLEPVKVSAVLEEALELVRPQIEAKNIALDRRKNEEFAGFVRADKQRLKQVFMNLLSNAVKFNVEGGKIGITCESSAGQIRIAVMDSGVGIPRSEQERIFVPFDRLEATRDKIPGTGLGLALAKGMTEAMGGHLSFASEEGAGSVFFVDLVSAVDPVAAGEAREHPEQAPAGPTTFTALVVEDNASNIHLLERVAVHRPGLKLICAMHGSTALELAEMHQPDMVLLDVHLPDMLGNEVLALLRQNPATSHIPVVVISADATTRQIRRLTEAGAADYLTKPLEVPKLLLILDAAMEKKAATE